MGGKNWKHGPQAEFGTIRAAREFAASYGTDADYCIITKAGRVCAEHRRDPSGNGLNWFAATPDPFRN